jgi:aryl-alcohol dehydrogenase-like predicted oxidoreductase
MAAPLSAAHESTHERRALGRTELQVSTLGMGCSRLGAFWQRRSPRDGAAAVRTALDAGINLFDTADCYARGLSERILGRELRSRRDDVIVCTKVGLVKTPRALLAAMRAGGRAPSASGGAACFEPAYLRSAAERSLRRLGTDRIDVLLLHEPSLEVIRRGDALAALADLVDAGHVRHYGVCTLDTDVALTALDASGIACLEVPLDVCRQSFAAEVIPRAHAAGVGILAIAPFGDGRLLGEVPGLEADDVIAACLREVISSPGVAAAVVGMSEAGHVMRNVAALAVTPPADSVPRVRARHCPASVDAPEAV